MLAPDLRGRADARGLGEPYGIAQHADDILELAHAAGTHQQQAAGAGHRAADGQALGQLQVGHALGLADAFVEPVDQLRELEQKGHEKFSSVDRIPGF